MTIKEAEKVEEKVEEEPKEPTLIDALGTEEEVGDEADKIAELIDSDGNLIVDLELPEEYQLEIMASELLNQLTLFHTFDAQWRSARGQGDSGQASKLFTQRNHHRLTAAIIQRDYPGAKALSDELAKTKSKVAKRQRKNVLSEE
jgi:hypothetical protein